jgi:hypothetical protein
VFGTYCHYRVDFDLSLLKMALDCGAFDVEAGFRELNLRERFLMFM